MVELDTNAHIGLKCELTSPSNSFLKLLMTNAIHQLRYTILSHSELSKLGMIIRVNEDYIRVERSHIEIRFFVSWFWHWKQFNIDA